MSAPRRRRAHRRSAPGTAPGHIRVDPQAPRSRVSVMAWGPQQLEESADASTGDITALRARHPVVWVNVDGLGDPDTLAALQGLFGLHPLAMEDVVNVHQRPKVEDYGDHLFVVLRMPRSQESWSDEQVSLFFGRGWVLSFQERPGDCLDPVRQRARQGRPRIRGSGADYLAYAILDAVVDQLFPVVEQLGDTLDALEGRIFEATGDAQVMELQRAKRALSGLRRSIWPLRDAVAELVRDDSALIDAETRLFLRDVQDHAMQLLEHVDSLKEQVSGLEGVALTVISNRMNEVMKVLTIIGTIFIPLGFVAGLYGMNFDPAASPWNMPELGWGFGYPLALALMVGIAGGLLLFFRRKGWL